MPLKGYVKIGGGWKALSGSGWVKIGGAWKAIDTAADRQWYKVEGTWRRWVDSAPPPVGPHPGKYVLSATSKYISPDIGGTSYAEFDTSFYQGYVAEVKARISWKAAVTNFKAYGRPTSTYYRDITADLEWSHRTIDHDLHATAVSEFNAGSAIGYNLTQQGGASSAEISDLRLVIVV